ncbi:MAG: hypothetical protein MUC83_10210 [Pirellula sp.]|jgi:hypothetical protein|nr:hypothetical protein [Pirellula sp.]
MASLTANHSTSFASVTPTKVLASSSLPSSQGLVIPNHNGDLEARSELLARILAREFPLEESVCYAFKNPISTELSEDAFRDLVPLLSEIINPSFLDQITGANKRFELHAKFLRGLAFCLNHLGLQSNDSHPNAIDSLFLYSLMPIYLASTREKIIPAVESTTNKLRHSVCIALWLRVMDCDAGYHWFEEQTRSGRFLDSTIEQSFRISIPKISRQYWLGGQCNPETTDTDQGLWELACQLIRGDSQIHVPKSIKLGVVSWEKILQHWNSLKQALTSQPRNHGATANKIVGPVEGSCTESFLPETLTSVSTQVESDTVTQKGKVGKIGATSAPASKDRRLVEIRSSSDPQLKKVLDQLLQRSREDQAMLTIAVVSRLGADQEKSDNWFSPMIDQIIEESETEDLKGFVTDAGELALMFYDVDKSDVAYWLRESFSKLRSGNSSSSIHTEASEQLIAGVAMVNAPSRSFQLDQLIEAAWRCRDGAAIQGANAVKTIEVY